MNAYHIGRIFRFELRLAASVVIPPPPVEPPVEPPEGTTSVTVEVAGTLTIITKAGAVVDYIVHLQPKA